MKWQVCLYIFVSLVLYLLNGILSKQLNIWLRFWFYLKAKFEYFGIMRTICFLMGWGNSSLWLVKYKTNTVLCHSLVNWNKTLQKWSDKDTKYIILTTWQQEDIEFYDSPDTKTIFSSEATGKIRISFENIPLKYISLCSDLSPSITARRN